MSSTVRALPWAIIGGSHSAASADMPRSYASRSKRPRLCASPSRTVCTPVLSRARPDTRSRAARTTSSATRPPMECPASAKRSGAVASTFSAIAGIEEKPRNEMTLTCATSPSRSGISAHTVSSHNSPERSRRGCFKRDARDLSVATVASTMVHSRERILARDLHQAVRDVCLWLPEAEEFVSHGAPNFRVRGKTFATYTVNHHGDGRVALWLNAVTGSQELHVRAEPKHFFVPPYVGPRGWLGVVLDRGIAWKRVAALVREA